MLDEGEAISTERVVQEARELAVAVGDARRAVVQRRDDVAQHEERGVDRGALGHAGALVVEQPVVLRARQVDQVQLAGQHTARWLGGAHLCV